MLELLSNDLEDEYAICSKERQQLWEDALPYLKTLDTPEGYLTNKFDILFDGDLYGFLSFANVPKHLIYPIMRLNGFTTNTRFKQGARITIYDLGVLEEIYLRLINDVVI